MHPVYKVISIKRCKFEFWPKIRLHVSIHKLGHIIFAQSSFSTDLEMKFIFKVKTCDLAENHNNIILDLVVECDDLFFGRKCRKDLIEHKTLKQCTCNFSH